MELSTDTLFAQERKKGMAKPTSRAIDLKHKHTSRTKNPSIPEGFFLK
jgi:hypothetical protein